MSEFNSDKPRQFDLSDYAIYIDEDSLPRAKKGTANSLRIRYKDFGPMTMADFEIFSALPPHPFWTRVESIIDFSFANELCAPLYSSRGQNPYSPELKLKIHFVQAYENLSDREMEMRLMYDLAVKRFVGVPMSFQGMDHSTIALDRDRLGDALFDACFHYVLAQARAHKLWGEKGDRWLMDSFHTHALAATMGSYRLIVHGILNIVQHLKRTNRSLFDLVEQQLKISEWFKKLPKTATEEERFAAFSMLVARAYSLLAWFEGEAIRPGFWSWENKKQQLRSLELRAILYRILSENTEPTDGSPDTPEENMYQKIPRKKRPKKRIVNAHDPDVRLGFKSKSVCFEGDKIQVVQSHQSGLIMEMEPIPGCEHDGERVQEIIRRLNNIHGVKPSDLVGDSLYGTGANREGMLRDGITLHAPILPAPNPTKLLSSEHFTYDTEKMRVTCPEGQTTTKRTKHKTNNGVDHTFPAQICNACPIKAQCTTSNQGRTIIINDHYDLIQAAKIYNASEEGQKTLKSRLQIERVNHELANHHELRHPRTRGRKKLRITAKMKGIVVNVKMMVKQLTEPIKNPFVRYKRRRGVEPVCL